MEQSVLVTLDRVSTRPTGELADLRDRIIAGLARHESLTQKAASSFVDCLENSIQLGWLLTDTCHLVKAGHWTRWVESNLAIGIERTRKLRRLASFFSRDSVGPALRTQIADTHVQGVNELLRRLNLRSGPSANRKAADALPSGGSNGNRNSQKSTSREIRAVPVAVLHPVVPLTPTEALIDILRTALRGLKSFDFSEITPTERKQIDRHLAPLNRFHIRSGTVAAKADSLDGLVTALEAALRQIDLFDFDRATFPQRQRVMEPIGGIVRTYERFQSCL